VVAEELRSLIPERVPLEWVAASGEEAGQVARRIADDVVFAGFPYMQGLTSPSAYFEEFKRAARRILWLRESAVTFMLHGDLEEAKRMLLRLARPVSQDPTEWADKDARRSASSRHSRLSSGLTWGSLTGRCMNTGLCPGPRSRSGTGAWCRPPWAWLVGRIWRSVGPR
jgi:hypothetical protein